MASRLLDISAPVARALNTSSSNISKRLKQAREKLRTILEKEAEP